MDAGTASSARKRYKGQNIEAAQDDDALLTVGTVATLAGQAVGTIRHWERTGAHGCPKAERRGRAVRWRARAVREWLKRREAMQPA
jgi:predicted DNA-binding transcriptional regulator AlpA